MIGSLKDYTPTRVIHPVGGVSGFVAMKDMLQLPRVTYLQQINGIASYRGFIMLTYPLPFTVGSLIWVTAPFG